MKTNLYNIGYNLDQDTGLWTKYVFYHGKKIGMIEYDEENERYNTTVDGQVFYMNTDKEATDWIMWFCGVEA